MGTFEYTRGTHSVIVNDLATRGVVVFADAFKLEAIALDVDLDDNGVTDLRDALIILSAFHGDQNDADLDGDGQVGSRDLFLFSAFWRTAK